jgi:hypothetical protein
VCIECTSLQGLNIRRSAGFIYVQRIKSLIPVSTAPPFYRAIRASTPPCHQFHNSRSGSLAYLPPVWALIFHVLTQRWTHLSPSSSVVTIFLFCESHLSHETSTSMQGSKAACTFKVHLHNPCRVQSCFDTATGQEACSETCGFLRGLRCLRCRTKPHHDQRPYAYQTNSS